MHFSDRLAASLLVALLIQNPLAAGAADNAPRSAALSSGLSAPGPLTSDQRALHALDRLTFGPRPGDVAKVEAMGVDKWIDQQLNPENIDDSALQSRLADYPAMRLRPDELERRFPSQLMVRELASGRGANVQQAAIQGGFVRGRAVGRPGGNGGDPENAPVNMPTDRIERAIYANQIVYYRRKKAEEAGKASQQNLAQNNVAGTGVEASGGQPQQGAAAGREAAAQTDGNAAEGDQAMMVAKPGGDAQPKEPQAEADPQIASTNSSGQDEDADQPRYSQEQVSQILSLPPDQRFNMLVGLLAGDIRGFLKHLKPQQKLQAIDGLTAQQKEIIVALVSPTAMVGGEVLQTRMLTNVYSERQLQAVMTDFWLNHFNVYIKKGPFAPWYLADYQNNVVGPRSMGKFEDLLVATAKSPAMLFYLDNRTSVGPYSVAVSRAEHNRDEAKADKAKELGLNENYAREVMELHTLGVDGGYTQQDVTEVAKVFTGWTIGNYRNGGQFEFNENRHEPGTKHVLGRDVRESGMKEGLEVLHMLATSPATAHHISQQLAVRFVSDNPPPALVDRMAATFLKSDGDIREVLRNLFASPEFWSKDAYRAKVKTPEEFVFSAVRATAGDAVQPQAVVQAIATLGMPLYGMQTPNGYPWKADAWVNSADLLARINFAIGLTSNSRGTFTDLDSLLKIEGPAALPPAEKELKLESVLLSFPLRSQTRAAVLKQLDSGAVKLQADGSPAETAAPMDANQTAAAELDKNDGEPAHADDPAMAPARNKAAVKAAAFKGERQADGPRRDLRLPAPGDKDAAVLAALLLGSPDFQLR